MTEYELALADGYVPEVAIQAKLAAPTTSRDYPLGIRHPALDMRKGVFLKPPEPVAPPPVLSCRVDGVEVEELAVLIKPTAFLVTTGNGTHEINRCYFQSGAFAFGVDMKRIGGISAAAVEYFPERGLYLHLERGYELFVPSGHCQATWRKP